MVVNKWSRDSDGGKGRSGRSVDVIVVVGVMAGAGNRGRRM